MKYALFTLILFILISCGTAGSKGEKGDKGDIGTDGIDGVTGTNSINGATIQSGFSCSKVSSGILIFYKSVLFTTGDRWVACTISNALESTGTGYYKNSQTGATTAGCLASFDLDSASGGFFSFSITSSTKTAVYNDTGSVNNGLTVTFTSSDCTNF